MENSEYLTILISNLNLLLDLGDKFLNVEILTSISAVAKLRVGKVCLQAFATIVGTSSLAPAL